MFKRIAVLLFLLLDLSRSSPAQQVKKHLPAPRGPYAVARTEYDWVDESRSEPLAKTGARRELLVYLWYPTKTRTKKAEYYPGAQMIAHTPASDALKSYWGKASPAVESGQIETDTFDASPLAGSKKRFPLIVFLPGLGLSSSTYTSLIQEVVSRGYIVASIEPTYEVPVVVFPDGRTITLSQEATGRHQPNPPGETREQFLKRLHASDAVHLDKWAGRCAIYHRRSHVA